MIEFLIVWQFISRLLTFLVGIGILLFIRKRYRAETRGDRPAGFWVRVICFGTDLAIIDILASFLAFHGNLQTSGYITILLTFSYFFFSWLFFAATPVQMLAKIKILSKDGGQLKIWQMLARLGIFVFLIVGWITILFDKKEKRAFHDIVAQTHVVYSEKGMQSDSKIPPKVKFTMLVFVVFLLTGLIVNSFGEKLTKYTQNDQIKFFDLNKDGVPDGLTIDLDRDGKIDVYKYDLDNDHIVDFTTFDADKDGVAESIDINNDGHIDGFDFNNDNKLDRTVSDGQLFIWLRRILFGIWAASFAGLLVFAIKKETV